MIIGIGTDIVEIERIKKAIENEKFLNKYFTSDEIVLYNKRNKNPEILAGNFVVKEAVSKAIGTGVRGFGLSDISVLRDELGKPYIELYNEALQISKQQGILNFHVSISHSEAYAVGFAIAEGEI